MIHFYYDIDEWELIDLEKDPMEMKNVYNDPAYSEIQADLHQRLEGLRKLYGDSDSLNQHFIEEYKEKVKANPMIEYWKLTPADMQRMFSRPAEGGGSR